MTIPIENNTAFTLAITDWFEEPTSEIACLYRGVAYKEVKVERGRFKMQWVIYEKREGIRRRE